METNFNSGEKSTFNEGMLQISRLDECWRACRSKKVRGDLTGWALELDAATDELSVDCNKINKEYMIFIEQIDDMIYKCYSSKSNSLNTRIIIKNKLVLIKLLSRKERFLRRVQDESGKGSKYEDSVEGEFE
jgi:hypothetical protein